MKPNKENLFVIVDDNLSRLKDISDYIFDHPEIGHEEYKACEIFSNAFSDIGFTVQTGICGMDTAFVATRQGRPNAPVIGLLCEYDALAEMGHGCGHHMQGPTIMGAAMAVKEVMGDDVTLHIWGTPAEETQSGKLVMAKAGIFDIADVVLMIHGSDSTTVDGKSLALNLTNFQFTGKAAHAAIAPEQGISALDAVLMFYNGMEFLREHVPSDVKMHGIITHGGVAANMVPAFAETQWYIRAEHRTTLDTVLQRVYNVAQGAALQVGCQLRIETVKAYDNKLNIPTLNALLLDEANKLGVPDITPPREKTGSTDFASVTYRVPGACLRVKYVPRGRASHSQGWLDVGKSQAAEDVIMYGAKTLAATIWELVYTSGILAEIKEEFNVLKKESDNLQ